MILSAFRPVFVIASAVVLFAPDHAANAALLAYEPFTNAPGTPIIGSGGGSGFAGAWQSNGSAGVATNTSVGLSYADANTNALESAGGAGFYQGLTSANSSMQPIRPFSFGRGTNDVLSSTTWISFIIVRQGPMGTAGVSPRGHHLRRLYLSRQGSPGQCAEGD